MRELSKKYNHKEAESKWQKYWEDNGIYRWEKDLPRNETFVVDTPPPTISGKLHMGHIFSFSQAEMIVRYQRMKGKTVFYPIGFDDNGLPTERYVEKMIGKKGTEMPRDEFVKICREKVKIAETEFENLFRSMAFSFDWNEKYQTISPMSQKIAQMSFIDLYNKGVLYRKEEPVIWDVVDQTALAQTEVEDKEVESEKHYLKFELVRKGNHSPLEGESLQTSVVKSEAVGGNKPDSQRFYSKQILENAKELRKNTTDAEKLLWYYLKNKQLDGYKFRRQQPFGNYILDFVCLEGKLVIELDGGQHGEKDSIKYDSERTKFLESKGYKVFRFWNEEIFKNMFDILDYIYLYLKRTDPSPKNQINLDSSTLPQGEGSFTLEIMTTRPELLPACVAVMICPSKLNELKEKYGNVEFEVITPLGVTVPLIEDDKVDEEKGTGVVMCCTFGDQTDVEWWKKHKLPLKIIIGHDGKIKNSGYEELEGLFVTKARAKIIEILKQDGYITRESEKFTHAVKVGERSKSPLEILVTKQWFVRVLDIKEELHKKTDECDWYPDYMKKRMHIWIDSLSWDWCVSRQRFSGIPIPVWYSRRKGEEGKVLVANASKLPVDPMFDLPEGYSEDEVVREKDIFDTWFTSSVSPQLSSHGITNELCVDKERFEKLSLPFDLRPQAHEIIRTWAFCTLVKSHYHQNVIPWKNVMISGWCLAKDKTKMSKSAGNVIEPQKLIDEKGTDAVRYWASTSTLGTDTAYSEDAIKIGNKLITKLWNSAKFAEMHFKNTPNVFDVCGKNLKETVKSGEIFEATDLWILSKLKKTIEKASKNFESFEYAKARDAVEDFFWNDFCDNYLEIAKVRCYGLGAHRYKDLELTEAQKADVVKSQNSGIYTIYYCINTILKLFSPFVPHITEEIFSCLFEEEFKHCKSINARGTWPKINEFIDDEEAIKVGEAVVATVAEVRKYKSDNNLAMNAPVKVLGISCDIDLNNANGVIDDLQNVTGAEQVLCKSGKFEVEINNT